MGHIWVKSVLLSPGTCFRSVINQGMVLGWYPPSKKGTLGGAKFEGLHRRDLCIADEVSKGANFENRVNSNVRGNFDSRGGSEVIKIAKNNKLTHFTPIYVKFPLFPEAFE